SAELVSSDYFTVLGITPVIGRMFARHEADLGGPAYAILGESLWKRKFEGAGDIVGKSIVLDGKGYTVIGVTPAARDLRAVAGGNVAKLMLARSAGRAREMGIRLALGASTGRLVRQLLTESLLLGVAGGALGLFVAWWCADTLFAVLPRGVPHVGTLRLDASLLAFTAAISLASGVLAGLTPALRSARTDLHDTLKEGGRGPSTTRY